jgi:hypothetical protein
MRKNLKNFEDKKVREVTRVGVYGVVIEGGQMLLIRQKYRQARFSGWRD